MQINDKRNSLVKHANKTYRRRARSEIRNIAIHHSATTSGSAEAFARYHVNQLDWPGVAYHYVINKDGSIDLCHDPEVVSYHVGNSNGRALGICMVGDFRTQTLDAPQRNAALELVKNLINDFNLTVDDVWGHIEFPGYSWKPCPSINMEQFRSSLREAGSPTSSPINNIPSQPSPRQIISRGDRGDDVKTIQQKLADLGFNPGPIDGIFGPLTVDAVERFQRSARIGVDGVVGPETRSALENYEATTDPVEHGAPSDEPDQREEQYLGEQRRMLRLIRPMMRGEDVIQVQEKVGALIDGVYGPATERSVMAFQRRNNLTVDGIVGPLTWRALDATNGNVPVYERILSLQTPMMRGDDVRHVQQALNVQVDGIFGPNTERAVREFQRQAGITVDGIVGPQTWNRLF
ncbi:peptidoglycan recognition protein family protein [Anaerobacillus isosaccharinicus]|uniref:Autolysin n=1 Tax=Anaerobacillus isosaccharinicus TaxID=1532552 RepID=A0A1S2LG14_9BACI|nr:N-acetylmuramoyl-L-alanine amidase [Anaerobacillus isosaccharinicus]MBA5587518.1 N-acetylmuramoyl-L-alanine amidase [Anaerobacillus isosaccharinicus]QOY34301.1 N-acetylmuramoyl-L-alanine amidase [Anaerobacillus isosaccharinicus]